MNKILKKLSQKDRVQFNAILKKMEEILSVETIDHYNVRFPPVYLTGGLRWKRQQSEIAERAQAWPDI